VDLEWHSKKGVKDMTIRHMKIFLEVYQTQNITRAADTLNMTQPAVSRAIQELERYYGVRLFERIHHRLSVTESGKQLYSYAIHIVNSFDKMEKGMRNWDELGILRIGASITLGNVILPDLIARFKKKHEQLQVRVQISNGAQLQQALLNNRLDLAMIEGTVDTEHLHVENFTCDKLVLILPPDHPLCHVQKIFLQQLLDYDFLLREPGSAGRSFLEHVFAVHGLPLKPAWESTSTHALIHAVHAGIGISFLPEQLVRPEILSGYVAARSIEDETFIRKHFLVWHQNKYLSPSAQDFLTLCEDFCTD
jgi:DNA-binding transcriptional LysR family regulator